MYCFHGFTIHSVMRNIRKKETVSITNHKEREKKSGKRDKSGGKSESQEKE